MSRFQITAGGRLDENEKFGRCWTYRATALAFAAPTTKIRASVGTGFKEPGFFENFDSPFSIGTPISCPRRTFSWRAASSRTRPRCRRRGTHGFRPALPRPHPAHPRAADAGWTQYLLAAANSKGAEAMLHLKPPGPVRGLVAYTNLDTDVTDAGFDAGDAATFVEGQQLLLRPNDVLALKLTPIRRAHPAGRVLSARRA